MQGHCHVVCWWTTVTGRLPPSGLTRFGPEAQHNANWLSPANGSSPAASSLRCSGSEVCSANEGACVTPLSARGIFMEDGMKKYMLAATIVALSAVGAEAKCSTKALNGQWMWGNDSFGSATPIVLTNGTGVTGTGVTINLSLSKSCKGSVTLTAGAINTDRACCHRKDQPVVGPETQPPAIRYSGSGRRPGATLDHVQVVSCKQQVLGRAWRAPFLRRSWPAEQQMTSIPMRLPRWTRPRVSPRSSY